jgi:hypothetical protein
MESPKGMIFTGAARQMEVFNIKKINNKKKLFKNLSFIVITPFCMSRLVVKVIFHAICFN